ncbi:hypothetical protein JEZ13_07665 [bacterium]|nr:hypothetical protein [bacterium]
MLFTKVYCIIWVKLCAKPAPIINIVDGVGFAPAWALLKQVEEGPRFPTTLLYISNDIFLCQKELSQIVRVSQHVIISYFTSRERFTDVLT